MRLKRPRLTLTIALAGWCTTVLFATVAWRESYDREFAYVRSSRDGRPYDTGYVVLNQGKLYLLDGIPADPSEPGFPAERDPARWWWSRYQSNGFTIDIIERSGDGASWGGFAYRTTTNGYHAIILPWWSIVLVLAILPSLEMVRRFARFRRVGRNCCVHCGYDLRATPERCPECGTAARHLTP